MFYTNPYPYHAVNLWPIPVATIRIAAKAIETTPTLGAAFKPKKAGTKTSHIIFILDESSSMGNVRDTTISGFNEYLKSQADDAEKTGIKTFASLYKFDGSNVNAVFQYKNVNEVEPLTTKTYAPSGCTNLLDAIGGVMMNINTRLSETKKADRDSIIVVILTDGEENSSRTFKNADIKQMVETAEGKNWGFMFMGANIDAFSVGSNMGFSASNTLQYNVGNMAESMGAASNMSSRMKSAYASGMNSNMAYTASTFTADEREKAND